ncbi:MAG TPA: hydroxyisourate hydrolase [Natronosporangium sp.]|nr:hydroxyisourate hydrolase [Natronosporangium sp.]
MGVLVEIMDCMFGRPAAGVPVQLLREAEPTWQEVVSARTGETGCVAPYGSGLQRGRYRLVLSLDEYFVGLGVEPFQSRVDVMFRVFRKDEDVRLLLMVTASSFSTCRLSMENRWSPDAAMDSRLM